jgi:cytochrome c oxidase subunit 3
MAVGAITWMHHMFAVAPIVFGVGVIGVLYTMLGWWRDVIREAEHGGFHTRVVQISHRSGMMLFIASEVMFFVAWFWAYFNTALFPGDAHETARLAFTHGVWPPTGIETFNPWHLPLLNTLILLTSGVTVTIAHHALKENKRGVLKVFLALTFLLGFLFVSLQAREYGEAYGEKGLTLGTGIYGSTFFMLTGFHGLHVTIGAIMLTIIWLRTLRGHFTPTRHFGFESVAWYLHFVDVVWLGLFIFVYWI